MGILRKVIFILGLLPLLMQPVWAQVTTATVYGTVLDPTGARRNEPMALPHEHTSPPCDGKTGLQYKFQGSSATVTYSRALNPVHNSPTLKA